MVQKFDEDDAFHDPPNILVRFVEKKRVIQFAFSKGWRKSLMKLNETYSRISIPIRDQYLFNMTDKNEAV